MRGFFFGFLVLLTVPPVCADPVRIALLPSSDEAVNASPIHQLLEVALTANENLQLVERAEVDRILDERRIRLSWADHRQVRASLGSLLRAELLVSIESEAGEDSPLIRTVVFRTADGVRLTTEHHEWDEEDPDAAASEIAAAILDLVQRDLSEEGPIVAVFPFIGRDLLRTHDSLQYSLPAIVNEILSRRQKLLSIEVEEAESIAEEIQLTGGGAVERDKLPFFISGTYENEVRNGSRTIALTLQLRQGGSLLAEESSDSIPPSEIHPFLEETARAFGDRIAKAEMDAPDRVQEGRALAHQGFLLHQRGEHEMALAHYEASLLVLPEAKVHHKHAMDLCARLMKACFSGEPPNDPDTLLRGQRFALRHLDHFERYLRSIAPTYYSRLQNARFISIGQVYQSFRWDYRRAVHPPELMDLLREYSDREMRIQRDYLRDLLERRMVSSTFADDLVDFGDFPVDRNYFGWLDPNSRNNARKELFGLIASHPYWFSTVYHIVARYSEEEKPSDYDLDFLAFVLSFDTQNVRTAIRIQEAMEAPADRPGLREELTALIDEINSIPGMKSNIPIHRKLKEIDALSLPSNPVVPLNPPIQEPTPEPIESEFRLTWKPVDNSIGCNQSYQSIAVTGWVPSGSDCDLVATPDRLIRIKRRDEFEVVYNAPGGSKILDLLPDGDSVWALCLGPETHILHWDGAAQGVQVLGPAMGFPPSNIELKGVVTGEGRLVLVGYFGRTWLGEVQRTPTGETKFELHFQATNEVGSPSELETAFRPQRIWVDDLSREDGRPTVFISRWFQNDPDASMADSSPDLLAFDPETRQVRLEPPAAEASNETYRFLRSREIRGMKTDSPERRRLLHRFLDLNRTGSAAFEDGDNLVKIDRTGVWIRDAREETVNWRALPSEPLPLLNPHLFQGAVFPSNVFGHVLYTEQKVFQVQLEKVGES